MAADRQFCYCWLDFQIAKVRREKYASPHLVYLRRLPRGMCGQGPHAYASIDHVDSRARYCRLDHWRCRDSPVLSAQCRGQISSWRINCIHPWSNSRFVHLAQVQIAIASRIGPPRERGGFPSVAHMMAAAFTGPRRAKGKPSFRVALKLTWTGSTLGWDCARSRFPNCEKRPLCLYR